MGYLDSIKPVIPAPTADNQVVLCHIHRLPVEMLFKIPIAVAVVASATSGPAFAADAITFPSDCVTFCPGIGGQYDIRPSHQALTVLITSTSRRLKLLSHRFHVQSLHIWPHRMQLQVAVLPSWIRLRK
jgi:hypothetical protein